MSAKIDPTVPVPGPLLRTLALAFLLTGAALEVPLYGQTNFQATLEGSQEVPPVATSASGSASLTLNAAQDSLTMSLKLLGVDLDGTQTPGTDDNVTGLHIHRAPAGSNGSVVFGMISPNSDQDGDLVINAAAGTVSSVWDGAEGNGTTLAAELTNLLSSGLYFNVHTVGNPSGRIRGQVLPQVDGVAAEAVRWRPRDTPPFTCDEQKVGHVYLQRDVAAVNTASHLLCLCVGVDNGSTTFSWRSFDGTVDCATLVAP